MTTVAHSTTRQGQRHKQNAPSHQAGEPTYIVQPGSSDSDSFKTYVVWGLVGTVVVVTVGYFGYKVVTKVISRHAAKGSLEPGEPAYYAQQIKMGIDNDNWLGTNTQQIRTAFVDIPDKAMFRKVVTNYHNQYGVDLYADLNEHLKSTEMQEMVAIYRIKPEKAGKNSQPIYDPYAWAERINAAVNFQTWGLMWGTDLEAIKQVVREIPDQKSWDDVSQAYESKYSADILDDLDDDVSSGDYDFREELSKKGITA